MFKRFLGALLFLPAFLIASVFMFIWVDFWGACYSILWIVTGKSGIDYFNKRMKQGFKYYELPGYLVFKTKKP